MVKKFICTGEPYESGGEEKMSFKRVGEIFTGKNQKEYVKWYTLPGVLLHVFEDKPKETTPKVEDF